MSRISDTLSICLIGCLFASGCGRGPPATSDIRPVRAFRVGDVKAIQGREFPGRAKAKDDVDMSFQISGPLVSLPVDVGTQVRKGDLVAAVDPRDFQAALDSAQGNLQRAHSNLLAMERGARPEEIEQLKAAVAEAEATYRQAFAEHERNAKLVTTGAVSRAEYDLTLARVERSAAGIKKAKEELNIGQAGARPEDLEAKRSEIRALEATVDNARNQLEYSTLIAPFDGEVSARYVNNYQTIQAKQPIVRLLDVSTIEITVQVPESLISLVPQVKEVLCRFDAFPDREISGRVTKIGSEASQTTRTYPVTVEIKQPDGMRVLPGMAAAVRAVPHSETPSGQLLVPLAAVVSQESNSQAAVWIVDTKSQKVASRAVKTGELTPGGIVIKEGLVAGEWVVTSGVNSLREGQQVRLPQERSVSP